MESGRRWLGGLLAAFAIGLLSQGCAGKSSGSEHDDGGRTSTGGTGTGLVGGTSSGGTSGRPPCFVDDSASCPAGRGCVDGVCVDAIVITDANNYRATSTLSIPSTETAPGDIDICWPEVTTDLACVDVDPTEDIDAVSFIAFSGLSDEEIAAALGGGELSMNNLEGFLQFETDHRSTCTKLSSFTLFGTPADVDAVYVPNEDLRYVFIFTRGTTPGVGAVTMAFATPVAGSLNTTLNASPGCGMLEVTADFSGRTPVRIPDDGTYLLDLRGVQHDALGNSLGADGLSLWFFAGATISDIEAHVLDLDSFATETFKAELDSWTADLSRATSPATGESFQGFARPEPGLWILGLTCTACTGGALPEFLAVLEPLED